MNYLNEIRTSSRLMVLELLSEDNCRFPRSFKGILEDENYFHNTKMIVAFFTHEYMVEFSRICNT